jgi:hypothetical protein
LKRGFAPYPTSFFALMQRPYVCIKKLQDVYKFWYLQNIKRIKS